MEDLKVLTMQSHVVHGCVGNRCAAFAMQLLGVETDVLNTVHFSNHTGYSKFKGTAMDAEGLLELINTMEENGLAEGYTHILTGYIGKPEFLEAVEKVLDKCKGAKFVCDPVLGDNGALYAPQEMVPLFKKLVRRADVITPNQYEAEILSESKIESLSDASRVCAHFHDIGIPIVVITSMEIPSDPSSLYVIGSKKGTPAFYIKVPKLSLSFTGTGDLLSSLILARSSLSSTLTEAVELALASTQAAISRTHAAYNQLKEKGFSTKNQEIAARELKLVQARHEIMLPEVTHRAVEISL
eukprot:TRINITY_DN8723_c3_g2_i1.p1 TRINITY_DN8723_c3_g2~~TRINITY_DN8723_c3_g2_i1.p1  ORF type:complete len:306 (+),score=48.86 TRINITY_DN8723_c3_g2_i1:26-919(+)